MASSRWKILTRLLALAWIAGSVGVAHGVTVDGLYETAQPVGDSREQAFVEALKAVVVRVSGQRDAAARLGAALNEPQKYVQRYGYTEEDVLQVGFDSISINRLLVDAGLPIWGRERPATLVLLGLPQADGSTRWMSAETPPGDREIIAKTAQERGLPLIWASLDAQELTQVGALGAGGGGTASLLQTAQRYGANAALVGRVRGGAVRWTLVSSDGASEATGGPGDGVHLAADAFAQVFATSGSTLDSVIVEVAGIVDLDAYALTLNYLEAMTLVRGVALEQVAGDTMRFRLAVRGDAETLRRAIALDRRLESTSSGDAGTGERLSFRYQP